MPKQYNAIVADTSCFILLHKLTYIHVLHELFGKVTTTPEVFLELKVMWSKMVGGILEE